MRTDKFVLDGRMVKPEPDLLAWGRWMETADRIVAKTEVGNMLVSTVFLGLDHSFMGGPPLLFETMVFDGQGGDCWSDRCSTWDEAEAMHKRGCDFARAHLMN